MCKVNNLQSITSQLTMVYCPTLHVVDWWFAATRRRWFELTCGT